MLDGLGAEEQRGRDLTVGEPWATSSATRVSWEVNGSLASGRRARRSRRWRPARRRPRAQRVRSIAAKASWAAAAARGPRRAGRLAAACPRRAGGSAPPRRRRAPWRGREGRLEGPAAAWSSAAVSAGSGPRGRRSAGGRLRRHVRVPARPGRRRRPPGPARRRPRPVSGRPRGARPCPTPPSAAMRASSSAAASSRSPRHSAQNAAVIAWWAATPVVPARSSALWPARARAGVVVEAPGGRLPRQHLHGDGGVGHVPELFAKLGRLAGVGERAGVVADPGAAGRDQRQARHQDAEAPRSRAAPGAVRPTAAWPPRSPRKPAAERRGGSGSGVVPPETASQQLHDVGQ